MSVAAMTKNVADDDVDGDGDDGHARQTKPNTREIMLEKKKKKRIIIIIHLSWFPK